MKDISVSTILLNIVFIILGTIITLGMPWILSFLLFIHIFPTYIILLITLIIMNLLPLKKYSKNIKILTFIFLATIIGLNINLLYIGQNRKVNEIFNKKLTIKQKDFIEIQSNSKNIPITYNRFDFLSFGSNEGCGCGYWEFPRMSKGIVIPYILGIKEIPFSWTKTSDKKIIINYKEALRSYSLNIKILKKNEVLSSLTIKDHLPFQGINHSRDINNVNYRLQYLLQHNIWNAILFYLNIGHVNNKTVISNFLNKVIDTTKKPKNWTNSMVKTTASLLYNSNVRLCTLRKDDDYGSYPFNTWSSGKKDYSIKFSPHPNRFTFNDNNITYTTLSYSNKFTGYTNILTCKTAQYFLILPRNSNMLETVMLKFTHEGTFIQEIHIKLPRDAQINGRNWHPLSHIKIKNNKMNFRINNIYEYNNKNNECSYSAVEIKI